MRKPDKREGTNGRVWAGNASANILNGGSAALFSLSIPAVLARHVNGVEFGLWTLLLQTIPYIAIFGFGLQTAIAARLNLTPPQTTARTIASAIPIAAFGAAVAACVASGTALASNHLFPQIPKELQRQFVQCLLFIGIGASLQILAQVPFGYFVGRHKSYVAALAQSVARFSMIALTFGAVQLGAGSPAIAALLGLPMACLAGAIWCQFYFCESKPTLSKFDRLEFRWLTRYCAELSIWSVSMALVNVASSGIVGHYDLSGVASFNLALVLTSTLGGIANAIMSPLVPVVAGLNGQLDRLSGFFYRVTFFSTLVLSLVTVALFVWAEPLITVWAGAAAAKETTPVLQVLLLSGLVRNMAMPYAVFLLGASSPRTGIPAALAEGLTCVLVSLLVAPKYGAIGVAIATLVGAIAGLVVHALYSFPRTQNVVPSGARFVVCNLLPVAMALIPAIAVYLFAP